MSNDSVPAAKPEPLDNPVLIRTRALTGEDRRRADIATGIGIAGAVAGGVVAAATEPNPAAGGVVASVLAVLTIVGRTVWFLVHRLLIQANESLLAAEKQRREDQQQWAVQLEEIAERDAERDALIKELMAERDRLRRALLEISKAADVDVSAIIFPR